ncbi:hypothetical protein ACLX1H_001672 [Fusarium chlamydosporum]
MDRLSVEILHLIAAAAASSGPQIDLEKVYDVWGLHDKPKIPVPGEPKDNSLAPYAAVSRGWQLAFEPFTFQTLILSPKRIAQAERQGTLTRRRLGYVRNIAVPITFPLPWPWDVPIVFSRVGEWPPPSDFDINDYKMIEDDESVDDDDALREDVEEVNEADNMDGVDDYMDDEDDLQPPEERGYEKLFTSIPEAERLEAGWFNPLYFDLGVNKDDLPELPVIASCRFDLVSWSLFFTPEAACKIASKMPHLAKVKMHLSDMEWRDPALRVRLREA